LRMGLEPKPATNRDAPWHGIEVAAILKRRKAVLRRGDILVVLGGIFRLGAFFTD